MSDVEEAPDASRYGWDVIEKVIELSKSKKYNDVHLELLRKYKIKVPIATMADFKNRYL